MTWHRVKIASSSSMYLLPVPVHNVSRFKMTLSRNISCSKKSLSRNVLCPKYPFPEMWVSQNIRFLKYSFHRTNSILFWCKKSPDVCMDGRSKGSKPSWKYCWRLIISTKNSLLWNLPLLMTLTNFGNIYFFIYTFLGKAFTLLILRTITPILQTGSLLYEITLYINANIPGTFDAQYWEFWF